MNNNYMRYVGVIKCDKYKHVSRLKVTFKADNVEGNIKITDVHLQDGNTVSGWVPSQVELLEKSKDIESVYVPTKFYNVLCRGDAQIVIPNRSQLPCPLKLQIATTNDNTAPFNISTQFKTKTFAYEGTMNRNDVLEFKSSNNKATLNQQPTNEIRSKPLSCPKGDTIFNVSNPNRDGLHIIASVNEYNMSKVVTY